MEDEVRLCGEETLYQGFNRLRRVHFQFRRYDGRWSEELDREILERPNGVALLPYDPIRDQIVLIRQFRAGAYLAGKSGWQWEPVGGLIDTPCDPEEVLHREAMEEAGCRVHALELIGDLMPMPGLSTEIYHTYCGWIDTRGLGGTYGIAAEEEDILAQVIDFTTAEQMLNSGKFEYLITAHCVCWLVANRERLRRHWCERVGTSGGGV